MIVKLANLATWSYSEGDDAKDHMEKRLKVISQTVNIFAMIFFVQRGKRHKRQGVLTPGAKPKALGFKCLRRM